MSEYSVRDDMSAGQVLRWYFAMIFFPFIYPPIMLGYNLQSNYPHKTLKFTLRAPLGAEAPLVG